MATKKIKRFQEGGMSDKDRGLEASKDEKVGFFERLRAGNIDDPSSEAYRRFGAGRGRAESSKAAPPVASEPAAPAMPQRSQDDAGAFYEAGSGVVNDTKPVITQQPRPGGKPRVSVAAPTKSTPTESSGAKTSAYPMTSAQPNTKTYGRSGGATADELANYKPSSKKTGADAIPGQNVKPVVGEKVEKMSDTERNVSNILAATGAGAGAAGMLYKGKKMLDARKAAQAGAKKRAELKRVAEEGIDRNLADEFKDLASSTAKTSAKKTKATSKNSSYISAREDAKADKAYKNLRDSDFIRSPRDDKTLNPMAWMSGPKGMADNFKKGGKVKSKKMSSGGSVSPASKRADGIATRGKTRCKIC